MAIFEKYFARKKWLQDLEEAQDDVSTKFDELDAARKKKNEIFEGGVEEGYMD